MNLLKMIKDFIPSRIDKVEHIQQLVGEGYYALRENTSKAGLKYTKLVAADKSSLLSIRAAKLVPQIGHNARRQAILDKRIQKEKNNGRH